MTSEENDRTIQGKGFLLTRSGRDQIKGTEIQLWLATKNEPVLLRIANERPVFFVNQSDIGKAAEELKQAGISAEIKSLSLKTFDEEPVSAIYSSTIHLHYRAQDVLRQSSTTLFEADIRLQDRFLMERFIQGGIEYVGVPVQKEGYIEVVHARVKSADIQSELTVLSLDIECDVSGELFSVGLAGCGVETVLIIGDSEIGASDESIEIHCMANEKDLLKTLVETIRTIDPDVICGWNLVNFDLRILLQRCERFNVAFAIGRDGQTVRWRDLRGENNKGFIHINGRVAIDGIDALKTATYQFQSFSLESVSQQLLGRGKKVEHSVDDRLEEIRYNFKHNKRQLAAYNLEDCRLVLDIFAHTRILDFLVLRSKLTGLEVDRAGGSVAAFSNLYLPRLHRAGYVAPNLPDDGGLASPGGYVMDSLPGLYENVLVLDFKSLYPSIIRTFKIDPLGLVLGLLDPDNAIDGFRGGRFHRDEHFLPEIITDLWQQRDIAKQQNDAPRSQAIKILMNSFYGVLGSGGCRFYDPRLASSITMRGHEIMQTTKKWIEEQGYSVIYGDTDSIFVWLENVSTQAQCRQTGKSLESMINARWREVLEKDYQLDCALELEFETHFKKFLMPTIRGSEAGSKKRYAGLVGDADSDTGERLVFKGLENVRTDWTELARSFQETLYDLVFHECDPTRFIRETADATMNGQFDHQLVYRKQLRRRLDQYTKNVPPHVRAARLADEQNRRNEKPLRYQYKGWIDYMMTLNGPEPLEYRSSRIDYQHYVDKQLKPIADAILPFINLDFDSIVSAQAEIFQNIAEP
ncbi:MAG: DNA polymerase II [Pseudomonadota bacterium]